MTGTQPLTFWRDEAGGRFYLVPADARLPFGKLRLRAGAAREIHVDAAAVARYEVSREEAQGWLDAHLDSAVERVKTRTEAWLDRVAPLPTADADASDPAGTDSADAAVEAGPGIKLLAELTRRPEARLSGDAEAMLRGIGGLFTGAADLVAQAREGEEGRAAVQDRLRALGDTLRRNGIAARG